MSKYLRSQQGKTFFFTVVTYQRRPILCLEESRAVMKEVLAEVKASHPFEIKAWILLPDHLHTIWELPKGDLDYSTRWALIKKNFTKRVRSTLPATTMTESRQRHREGAIWQRRFWEHFIRDEEDYRRHLDYIHYNPVKHGLVSSPKRWAYSTFHRYVERGIYPEGWGEDMIEFSEEIFKE